MEEGFGGLPFLGEGIALARSITDRRLELGIINAGHAEPTLEVIATTGSTVSAIEYGHKDAAVCGADASIGRSFRGCQQIYQHRLEELYEPLWPLT